MATAKKTVSRKAKTGKKADQTKMDKAVNVMDKMFFRQGKERKEILPVLMKECGLSKAGCFDVLPDDQKSDSRRRILERNLTLLLRPN